MAQGFFALLEAEEVPRRLRRVRRAGRVGRLLERRVDEQRPHDQQDVIEDRAEKLGPHQVGPVCTLSSPGPVAFLIGTSTRLPASAASGFLRGVAIALTPPQAARSRRQNIRRGSSTKTNGSTRTRAGE